MRQTEPISFNGKQVFDTSLGTVHLVVGGGGAASTIGETIDSATGFTQAHPFARSREQRPGGGGRAWLGFYDTANAYGYAVFDVDPGDRPVRPRSRSSGSRCQHRAGADDAAGEVRLHPPHPEDPGRAGRSIVGRPAVGHTVTADPGNWSPGRPGSAISGCLPGLPITGATS